MRKRERERESQDEEDEEDVYYSSETNGARFSLPFWKGMSYLCGHIVVREKLPGRALFEVYLRLSPLI